MVTEGRVGQLDGLVEGRQPHRVSAVGLGHVSADLGDFGGYVGLGSQPTDAVVAADEPNFLAQSLALCMPLVPPPTPV